MKKNLQVVCAIMFDKDNNVCITQRNDPLLSGLWEFPGGKIEIGESENDALVREIKEELDVNIWVEKHFITTTHEYPDVTITLISYICTSDSIVTHSHVHKQVLYAPIGELSSYSFAPADIPIVEKLGQIVTTLITP
jgi:8-oxo-dGTP diphosphatase